MKMSFWLSLAFALVLSGCAGKSSYLPIAQVPASNFEEIRVAKPYDFVYLGVFDTVNELSAWNPEQTLKADGLIVLQNSQFSRFDDSDRRVLRLKIRRDSQYQTSVFLEPESRSVIGASDVLEAIRKKFGVTA